MQIRIDAVESNAAIETVCKLAKNIWTEHYTALIGSAQVAYMLETLQKPHAVAQQLQQGYRYYLTRTRADDAAVGYFCLRVQAEKSAIHISKIYVLSGYRGAGIGYAMLHYAQNQAASQGLRRLWLTVHKRNKIAIDFYLRFGFAITAPLVQPIGRGYVMDDYHLHKAIGRGAQLPGKPNSGIVAVSLTGKE